MRKVLKEYWNKREREFSEKEQKLYRELDDMQRERRYISWLRFQMQEVVRWSNIDNWKTEKYWDS